MNTDTDFANNRIESLLLGLKFDEEPTSVLLLDNFSGLRYRDAYHVQLHRGECWLFEYGVVIFWGVDEDSKQNFLNKLHACVVQPFAQPEFEHLQFNLNSEADKISGDCLYLISAERLARLAASHGLAQSMKLSAYENQVLGVIENNEYIPRGLANTGNIPLGRKQLARLRGALFVTRSDVILNFNLLDTPDFFWEHPELEALYNKVALYLDLNARITLLNKKLDTVYELLQMLADEQNHKHSALLEWIIIVLIAIDIVIYFIPKG